MKIIITLFLLLSFEINPAQDFKKNYSTLRLNTLEQKAFSFNDISKNTASVFVFLLPDCPACESYSLTLNQLSEKYNSSGIVFYGVFPGDYNTIEEMKEYQSKYHIHFTLMTDPEKKLVKSLGAKITPEVFVLSNTGQTLYRGRIDDWMYAVGKKKPLITKHELQDALVAVANHQPVKVPFTKPIGCIIE